MKQFTRVEPTDVFDVGEAYKHQIVVKRFKTDDGKSHEFTTMYGEDVRSCAVEL